MAAGDPHESEASLQHALDTAFRFLARRDRTVAEVRHRLEGAEVDPAVVGRAIAVLTDHGYLDDARFARRFAEDRRSLDGWGSRRIEQRLLAAGVDRELAADAARRAPDAELQGAIEVLRRRVSRVPSDNRERDRALGFLLRRGYEFELACDAVRAHVHGRRAA